MPIVKYSTTHTHQKYRQKSKLLVPGASTIAGLGEDAGGMIHKAWQLGSEGLNYREVWNKKRDAGSAAHFLIERFLRGEESDMSEVAPDILSYAETSVLKFMDWWGTDKKAIHTETQMTSELYPFGGTADLIYEQSGVLHLADYKTGKLWPSAWRQLAALRHLAEDLLVGSGKIQSVVAVRIGIDADEETEIVEKQNTDAWFHAFLKRLDMYWADKQCK